MEYPCEFYVMDIFEPEWSVAALHDVFQNTPQLFEQFQNFPVQDALRPAQGKIF